MLAVNYTTLRDNMKYYFDRVSEDYETMVVTRKNENMIVMSQSSYDSLMETVHLVSSNANYNHLMRSIQQHKDKQLHSHGLLEDSEDV